MTTSTQIKVWDPLIRFFHWSLVSAFVIAFVTEDDFLSLHSRAGYLILVLIGIRFIWGFIGSRYARFSDFVYAPRQIIRFLRDTVHLRAKRYLGHNPAGGAMVIMLMLGLLSTAVSGMVLLAAEQHTGPLAGWFAGSASYWNEGLEEVHEFFANFTLLLVVVHVAGVLLESRIHRENLVSAMFSGIKSAKSKSH